MEKKIKYGEFIRKKRKELGLTIVELAKKTSFSRPYISMLENGKVDNIPSEKVTHELACALELNDEEKVFFIELVDYERIPERLKDKFDPVEFKKNIDHTKLYETKLPIYGQVSAGKGRVNMGNVLRYESIITLPGDRLPPGAFGVDVVGDSMWPTLLDGDLAIIDPRCEDVNLNGEICVISYESEEFIKRIKVTDKFVILISDNPDRETYEDIIVPRNEFSDFRCHGFMIESRRRYKKKKDIVKDVLKKGLSDKK